MQTKFFLNYFRTYFKVLKCKGKEIYRVYQCTTVPSAISVPTDVFSEMQMVQWYSGTVKKEK